VGNATMSLLLQGAGLPARRLLVSATALLVTLEVLRKQAEDPGGLGPPSSQK
jgi:hypothetical protein